MPRGSKHFVTNFNKNTCHFQRKFSTEMKISCVIINKFIFTHSVYKISSTTMLLKLFSIKKARGMFENRTYFQAAD